MTDPLEMVNVRYMVADVQELLDFYTTHLGFEPRTSAAPAFADVTRGRLRLLLSGPTSSAGRSMADGAVPEMGCACRRTSTCWRRTRVGLQPRSARLGRGLRREYPDLSVSRPQHGPRGLVLHAEAPDTPPVQVQILKAEPAESVLATAVIAVNVRYARLPATVDLRVPTPASFVAMTVAAYRDRAEPRDLFDLARLADRGHVTAEAREAARRLTGATPTAREFALEAEPA